MSEPFEIAVVLTALPATVPPAVRVRRCLKGMLRTYRLKAKCFIDKKTLERLDFAEVNIDLTIKRKENKCTRSQRS